MNTQNQTKRQNTTKNDNYAKNVNCVKNAVTISQPITIPNNVKHNTSTAVKQYSLQQNCFNPNNASPPSSWNFRLMKRISDEVPIKSL
jgi:hypothetical protein